MMKKLSNTGAELKKTVQFSKIKQMKKSSGTDI